MKWQDVRQQFPDQWLLFLAVSAESADHKRIINELAPIEGHTDFQQVWKTYQRLHEKDNTQELYIYHTSNHEINIKEIPAPTIRVHR